MPQFRQADVLAPGVPIDTTPPNDGEALVYDAASDTYIPKVVTLAGGLAFQDNWNAFTNTPDLTTAPPVAGKFWYVAVAGITNLGGITDWEIGDWAVSKGAGAWVKVDNTDSVVSVNAKQGAVILDAADVAAQSLGRISGVAQDVNGTQRIIVGDGEDAQFPNLATAKTAILNGDFGTPPTAINGDLILVEDRRGVVNEVLDPPVGVIYVATQKAGLIKASSAGNPAIIQKVGSGIIGYNLPSLGTDTYIEFDLIGATGNESPTILAGPVQGAHVSWSAFTKGISIKNGHADSQVLIENIVALTNATDNLYVETSFIGSILVSNSRLGNFTVPTNVVAFGGIQTRCSNFDDIDIQRKMNGPSFFLGGSAVSLIFGAFANSNRTVGMHVGTLVDNSTAGTLIDLRVRPTGITDGDVTWLDNIKALFGTAGDSGIYYDGTDLFIDPKIVGSGIVQLLGGLTVTGALRPYGGVGMIDGRMLDFGSAADFRIFWSTAQAEHTLIAAMGATSKSLVFTDIANLNKNHDHAAQVTPTIFIHSTEDPDVDNTEWISITHDGTKAVIDSGKGGLDIAVALSATNLSGTNTGDEIVDAYRLLEIAGLPAKGGSAPSVVYYDNTVGSKFSVGDEIYYRFQYPPGLKAGANIVVHLQCYSTNTTALRYVGFEIAYKVVVAGDVVSGSTGTINSGDVLLPIVTDEMFEVALPAFIPPSHVFTDDAHILMKLTRKTAAGTPPTSGNNPIMIHFEVKYLIDRWTE